MAESSPIKRRGNFSTRDWNRSKLRRLKRDSPSKRAITNCERQTESRSFPRTEHFFHHRADRRSRARLITARGFFLFHPRSFFPSSWSPARSLGFFVPRARSVSISVFFDEFSSRRFAVRLGSRATSFPFRFGEISGRGDRNGRKESFSGCSRIGFEREGTKNRKAVRGVRLCKWSRPGNGLR